MRKKILISAYCEYNLGDDLFLKILFERYKNVDWYILTNHSDYSKVFSKYTNVKIKKVINSNRFYKVNSFICNYSSFDAFIHIGGSLFIQSEYWKLQYKERKYIVEKFNKMNKPVFILGANFGPYFEEEYVNKYKKILSKYEDVCFRDKYSYDLFKDLDNVRLSPDIVYQLGNYYPNADTREKIVGISIMDIEKKDDLKKYAKEYDELIKNIINKFISLGYSINLLSFCKKQGDLDTAISIKCEIDKKYPNKVSIVSYEGDIDLFIEQFKSLDMVVGTRFHSVILGYVFNKPVLPIIYSKKTYNAIKDVNLDDVYIDIKDIKLSNLDEIIKNMQLNKLKNRSIFQDSEKQFEKLDKFIRYK